MKKIVLLLLTVLLAVLPLAACTDSSDGSEASIQLSASEISLEVFGTVRLTARKTNIDQAIVWSSDNPQVASVDNGIVTGVSAGTATVTASAGDASASCLVTVEPASDFPVLTLSQTSAEPLVGGSVSVTASIRYRGESADAEYSWSSEDPSVARVENGVITGVAAGDTIVVVSAEFQGELLRAYVSVSVKADISLVVNAASMKLYTTAVEDKPSTGSLSATLSVGGEDLSSLISWESSDESVVTVSQDGTVSAQGKGSADVSAVYRDEALNRTYTAACTVEVEIPTVAVVPEAPVTLEYGDGAALELSAFGITAQSGQTFEFYDVAAQKSIPCTLTDNLLTLDKTALLAGDSREIELRSDKIIYSLELTLITKTLTTADDLINFIDAYGNLRNTASGCIQYDGYYVLGGNIDLGASRVERTLNTHFHMQNGGSGPNNQGTAYTEKAGFNGIFDGRGYTIFNGEYLRGGLFGTLGADGIVRNVAFVNAAINTDYQCSGVIGANVYGTLSNVMIDASMLPGTDGRVGSAIGYGVGGATLENVVVYLRDEQTGVTNRAALWYWSCYGTNRVSNVYLFTDITPYIYTPSTSTAPAGVTVYPITGMGSTSVSGLTADCWSNTSASVPAFKSYLDAAPAYLEQSVQAWETSYANGTVSELAVSLENVVFTSDSADVSFEDGKMIVAPTLDALSQEITVRVALAYYQDIYAEKRITLTYEGEIVRLTEEFAYEQYSGYRAAEGKTPLAYEGVPNEAAFTVDLSNAATAPSPAAEVSFTLTAGGSSVQLEASLEGNFVTVANSELLKATGGEYEFSIAVGPVTYTGELLLVTRYLQTKADVEMMQAYGNVRAVTGGYAYDGYFVLTGNIDMGEAGFSGQANLVRAPLATRYTGGTVDKSAGFTGVFDGRGYTLLNGKYRAGGLFGAVAETGLIKNVGISNATIDVSSSMFNAIIGYNLYGRIENAYINVNFSIADNGQPTAQTASILAMYMNAPANALKDVVIYATRDDNVTDSSPSSFVNWPGGVQSCQNAYLFTDIPFSTNVNAFTGISTYSIAEIGTAAVEVTGLDETYWLIGDSGEVPVFRTAQA